MKISLRQILLMTTALSTTSAFALPIDWNGSLGVDYNTIVNANSLGSNVNETQHVRFQSYVLKLNPSIIVNDSATIKAEISTGNFRGGFLGGNSEWGGVSASSYYNTHADGNSTLAFNQVYAELYGDIGLFRVGKFSKGFGLGAVLNNGSQSWDRFYTQYDGIEAELKLGNLTATPTWAKIYSDATKPRGSYDIIEKGITGLYDNSASNMKVGLYYGVRDQGSDSTFYNNSNGGEVNIIDIFFEKNWNNIKIALEIPMITGKVGSAYGTGQDTSFESNAYILESKYELNSRWHFELNSGLVQGDDGTTTNFEGMYLHPNYKVSNILFNFDYQAFNDANRNPFQASLNNVQYIQVATKYLTDSWNYNLSATMASANKVAQTGKAFYDHENRTLVANAVEDQTNDLGVEIDFGFDYIWNPSILLSGSVNYLSVGDYFKFDNNASSEKSISNITSYNFNMSVNF